MLFEIKQLLAANTVNVQMTNAGETHQVVIEADNAVRITVTGTKEQVYDNLLDQIRNRMKEIHDKKAQGLKVAVEPVKKATTPKKDNPKPKVTEKEAAVVDPDDPDMPDDEDDEANNTNDTPVEAPTPKKEDTQQTLF